MCVWVSVVILSNSSLTLFVNILLAFSILIKKKITSGRKKRGKHEEAPQALCLKCISVFPSIFQGQTYFMLLALSSLHDGSPAVLSPRYIFSLPSMTPCKLKKHAHQKVSSNAMNNAHCLLENLKEL